MSHCGLYLFEGLCKIPQEATQATVALKAAIAQRFPERHLLDIFGNVAFWTDWTRHFGPPSGTDLKLQQAKERYIITTFGYGCNLGATQTARHTRGLVTPHKLPLVNPSPHHGGEA